MAKIEDAVVNFLCNNGTFFASLLSQMARQPDKTIKSVRTSVHNGRTILKYNPDFLEPRTMKDTKSILEHECLHLVMEHDARFKDKDHDLAHIATDVAINQMLTHVPADALTVDNIFQGQAQRNQDAEYYYKLLEKMSEQQKEKAKGQGDGNCSQDFDGDSNDGTCDQELQKEVVKQMVKEAMKTAQANGQGHLPAGLERYLEEMFKPPEIGWRQLLRRFVAASVKSGTRPSWKKESRRFGDMQKGRVADRTVSLVIAIDTSGSIDDGALQCFIDEIKGIQACYKSDIHVIECDASVGKYYKLRKFGKVDRKLSGGGGTDFRPVFNYVKQKSIRCDALIFFTDLCGTFPDKKPPYPVLWGYYNPWGGRDSAPFGTVIPITKDKEKKK